MRYHSGAASFKPQYRNVGGRKKTVLKDSHVVIFDSTISDLPLRIVIMTLN